MFVQIKAPSLYYTDSLINLFQLKLVLKNWLRQLWIIQFIVLFFDDLRIRFL